MFKLTYADLNHDSLIPALKKLGTVSGLEMRQAYNVAKVFRDVAKEQDIAKDRFRIEQQANKSKFEELTKLEDEAAKTVAMAEFEESGKAALKTFFAFEVSIDRDQIPETVAEKAGLTAFELEALEKVLVKV